jgi:hypothetical protein
LLDVAGLKQVAHSTKLTQTTRLLLCLAVGDGPKTVAQIKKIAKDGGIPAKNWNVSSLLSASPGAISIGGGWELTGKGRTIIEPLAGPLLASVAVKAATSLRAHLPSIANARTREFVEEAISCLEHEEYRAAVVLSWVGAVSLLYDDVIAKHLSAFNAEATKRNAKWKPAKNADDLALMKEYDFLQILPAISVLGGNVKTELEGALKLRNGCGHPSSLKIAEHRAFSHIEVLVLNVFSKF